MFINNGQINIWRIVIMAIVAGMLSLGGWVFSGVRDMPVVYESIESHDADFKHLNNDIEMWDDKLQEQQTRIEGKIDETNKFLRNHFANQPITP